MGPQIYIWSPTQVYGPYEFAHVQAGAQRGEVTPQHTLSYDGRQWFPAAQIWPQLVGQAGYAVAPAQVAAPPFAGSPAQVSAAGPYEFFGSEYSSVPGRLLVALFGLVFVGYLCSLAPWVLERLWSPEEAQASLAVKLLNGAAAALRVGGIPAAYIYLTFWVHRAAAALERKQIATLRFAPAWACALFYVPVLNIAMPAAVLQNLWKASDWTTRGERRAQGTAYIPLWWTFFVGGRLFWSAVVGLRSYLHEVGGTTRLDDGLRRVLSVLDELNKWTTPVDLLDAVGWLVGLFLFISFDGRLKTQVEME